MNLRSILETKVNTTVMRFKGLIKCAQYFE